MGADTSDADVKRFKIRINFKDVSVSRNATIEHTAPLNGPDNDAYSNLPFDDDQEHQESLCGPPNRVDNSNTHLNTETKTGFLYEFDLAVDQFEKDIKSGIYDKSPEAISRKLKELHAQAMELKKEEQSYIDKAQRILDEEFQLRDQALVKIKLAAKYRSEK